MEVAQQLFDPETGLFEETADRLLKPFADSALANPSTHLRYLRFAGKFVAKAIIDMQAIPVRFTSFFYKRLLLGDDYFPVDEADYAAEDPEHYKNLQAWLLTDVVAADGMTFTVDRRALGETSHVNLIENGDKVLVDNNNKHEYVRLLIEYKLKTCVAEQMDAFIEGFLSVIPRPILRRNFSLQELPNVIAGVPFVDVVDLMENTEYTAGYTIESEEIVAFWEVVREMNTDQLFKLIKFVTGSSTVPLGGFAHLKQGALGRPGKFTIERTDNTDLLPHSHTCFNTLVLPAYASEAELEWKLKTAIEEGNDAMLIA